MPRVEVSERHSILDLRPKRAGRLLRRPRLGADAGERYGPDDGHVDLRRVGRDDVAHGRDGERLPVRGGAFRPKSAGKIFSVWRMQVLRIFLPHLMGERSELA